MNKSEEGVANMRLVRIGLASIDTTVGAFRQNTNRALAVAHDMAADGVTIGVLPEQAIGGYPVEDLIQWQGFVSGSGRSSIASHERLRISKPSSSSASLFCTKGSAITARRPWPAEWWSTNAEAKAPHLQHLL